MIPKVFHRVWLGGKPIPFYFQKWGESWLKKHPGWTMKLWTEQEIQRFTNVDVLPKCSTLAMRSDVVRYEVLHREGGVYLDTDMECLKNIEILIQETEFFACWQRPDLNVLSNAIFGASKGHKILQTLTWGCRTEFRPEPWNAMGPTYFTPKVLGQPGVKIFKRETFIPYTRDQYKAFPKHPMLTLNPPEESFAINHRSSLWFKDSTSLLLPVKP